jgi:hypothetical protein
LLSRHPEPHSASFSLEPLELGQRFRQARFGDFGAASFIFGAASFIFGAASFIFGAASFIFGAAFCGRQAILQAVDESFELLD